MDNTQTKHIKMGGNLLKDIIIINEVVFSCSVSLPPPPEMESGVNVQLETLTIKFNSPPFRNEDNFTVTTHC